MISGDDGGLKGNGSGSSCLSLFGLPKDGTEREVHVLFSNCPGFVRCIVVPGKDYKQKPYAFIQFDTQDNALSAMESRQGTTWEEGLPAVNIEQSKRDIPDNFHSRQIRTADVGYVNTASGQPASKRARVEAYPTPTWQAPAPAVHSAPRHWPRTEDGPKTLHIGGLPTGISQADLDEFLYSNFGSECVGGKLTGGGKGESGRAFVGFISHDAALQAQNALDGLEWEGTTLKVEWARTEYRPPGGSAAAPMPAAPLISPHRNGTTPIGYGKNGPASWPAQASSGGKCTLHFTNLPFVSDEEFEEYFSSSFPDQVECCRFVDKHDGKPPVAWVRFVDEASAASIADSHYRFDWQDKEVMVAFARTELNPNKGGGKGR